MNRMLRACLLTLGAPVLLAPWSDPLRAQERDGGPPVFQGVLRDAQTRSPIATVEVEVLRENGSRAAVAITDAAGRFRMVLPGAGTYRVRLGRIGYAAFESPNGYIGPGETATVELFLSPSAVLLDSLLVTGGPAARRIRATEQLIHGRLLDDDTREPITQAQVQLLSETGSVVANFMTDPSGLFRFVTPTPGAYRLRAERIGYRTADSPRLQMLLGDTVRLDFFLSTQAVLMAPITVTASAKPFVGRHGVIGMQELYNRMQRMRVSGEFMIRDSIASYQRRGYTTSRMLMQGVMAMRGVTGGQYELRGGGRPSLATGGGTGGCTPRVYMNGTEMVDFWSWGDADTLDSMFALEMLEAVEVFTAPNIPAEFGGGFPCGVIVFWQRQG